MTTSPSLLGRDAELAQVVERLAERRLVTIVGPGGIGKTTLARAAARAAAPMFDDGVRAVDLTVIDELDGVRESLATQLGYRSFGALLEAPSDHPVLLLVDNCEHVVDAVAEAVELLFDACDMPTVLATSRRSLGVVGEAVVPLGPLALPTAGQTDGPAVRLFIERARDAGVEVNPSLAVAELCRRLDGVPLGIELAAARSRSMTPEEVLERLASGLAVLDRSRRRSAQRHRSLRAAIDWSCDLLDDELRRLFADLSVFAGPFDATSAHAVAAHEGWSVADTQDRLHELVEASMVVAEPAGDVTRFRLLETVRARGRELLEADGRRHLVESRFVDHVVASALDIIARGAATWSSDALRDLGALYGSIATALRWCLANDDAPDRAVALAAVLWGLVHQAHTEEIGDLVEAVLARWPMTDHPMWPDAVATAATCRYMLGRDDDAVALATATLQPAERSSFAPATLRRAIAQSLRAVGDTDGALVWFEEAADAARRLGLVSLATEADAARAQILADIGRIDEALELVGSALAEARSAGSAVGIVWATAIEGSIRLRSDPSTAEAVLRRALDDARRIGYDAGVSVAVRCLAFAALAGGEVPAAAAHCLELLDDLLARGSTYELRLVLDVSAAVLSVAGRHQLAADLAATARRLPVVSITASVGHELVPVDATSGTALGARDAIVAVRAALAELSSEESRPAGSAAPATTRGTFRPVGDMWEIGLGGVRCMIRASKGIADLAVLLASRGREIHCLDLVGAGAEQADTGAVIDDQARRAYEERIRSLQADIDEAETLNDTARADRARLELDLIVDELTAALGVGGRTRRSGTTAERARSTVTQRIRSAIARISALDPDLGAHLRASIRTGTWCSYAPEVTVEWELSGPVGTSSAP